MPKFYRTKSKKSTTPITRRTFVGKSFAKVRPPKPPVKEKVETSVTEKEINLHSQASSTISSLNELLQRQTKAEKGFNDNITEENNAVFKDEQEVEAFNGISDLDEQEELYDTAIDYERKKTKAVAEQVKLIEEESEKEKRALENEIKELRRELHRTAPLHDTKFFTLSKELKEAISEIEKVAGPLPKTILLPTDKKEVPLSADTFKEPGVAPEPVVVEPKEVVKPPNTDTVIPEEVKEETLVEEKSKKLPKKKMLITGASAIVFFVIVSNVIAGNLGSTAKVDNKIVEAYLSTQTGQVQGAQSVNTAPNTNEPTDPSQSDVSFDQSIWEEFNDPMFGVMLQYPKNAVKAIRTDSNITFVRKTGYLFKIQRIETSLSLDDYWLQIKPTSLNFAVATDSFKGKTAMKLTLEDMTDYPGDRIMIKEGGFIYDIWYASPSKSFTADDMKRVEKMLASLSIVGSKE